MSMLEPFGPIGIIAHSANDDFVRAVSNTLYEKRKKRFDNNSNPYINSPGYLRTDYLIDSSIVRFQTGEGKFQLAESVRGHDLFIITDVLAHREHFEISGFDHVISPDDQFRDLIRIISTCSGKARRINVIMPFVYEGRREIRDNSRESWDCADMLRQLFDLGVANFVAFDPHDVRIANAVPLMGMEFPRSAYKIITTLLSKFDSVHIDKDKCAFLRRARVVKKNKQQDFKLRLYLKLRDLFAIKPPFWLPTKVDNHTHFLSAYIDDNLCAFFGYVSDENNKTISVMNVGIDDKYARYSPGMLAMYSLVQYEDDSIRGFDMIDFTLGAEKYKYALGGVTMPVHHLKLKMLL